METNCAVKLILKLCLLQGGSEEKVLDLHPKPYLRQSWTTWNHNLIFTGAQPVLLCVLWNTLFLFENHK